jgi:hypothetical protein
MNEVKFRAGVGDTLGMHVAHSTAVTPEKWEEAGWRFRGVPLERHGEELHRSVRRLEKAARQILRDQRNKTREMI